MHNTKRISPKYKKALIAIFAIFLVFDISFSFVQYYHQSFDGDVVENVAPANYIKPILNDPIGLNVLIKGDSGVNPNRFFSLWTYKTYFEKVPISLQNFLSPIDSIYASAALFKIFVQIGLIFLLSLFITKTPKFWKLNFLLSALLVSLFFQTNVYSIYLGIIDSSITYVFYYAFPFMLLMLYLVPFVFNKDIQNKKILNTTLRVLAIPFAFVVCLSGPLNPGAAIIISLLALLRIVLKNIKSQQNNQAINSKKLFIAIRNIPSHYWNYFMPLIILSLYSLYIGTFNSMWVSEEIPIQERYFNIHKGVFNIMTQKLGYPLLVVSIIINSILIKYKYKSEKGTKILYNFNWLLLFILFYALLLPLGGYRPYRPYILRYDTIIPITICLVFMFGVSTMYLIQSVQKPFKIAYYFYILFIIFIYTNADRNIQLNSEKERKAITLIAQSKDRIVKIPKDYKVLSWHNINSPQESEDKAKLLLSWNIIKEKKLFYNSNQ